MVQRIFGVVAAASLGLAIACSQTDPGITTKVKAKFAGDDIVKAYQVDVTTHDGVVTLSGDVETSVAKEQAVKLARETAGVREVVDKMHVNEAAATSGLVDRAFSTESDQNDSTAVKDSHPGIVDRTEDAAKKAGEKAADAAHRTGAVVTDAAITATVKTKFVADTAVQALKIDVDTKDGVVTLTGTVPSRAEVDRAMMLARDTDGVKRVVNRLHVGA